MEQLQTYWYAWGALVAFIIALLTTFGVFFDAQRKQVTVGDTTAMPAAAHRFIRLRVTGPSAQTTTTAPMGDLCISFSPGNRFTGMSLENPGVLRDAIISQSATVLTLGNTTLNAGALLDATQTYFVELTGGPASTYVGERLELDVATTISTANNTLTVLPSSMRSTLSALPGGSALTGYTLIVRPHMTLGQLFGTKGNTTMQGAMVVSGADQVLLLNPQTQAFETYYLLRSSNGSVVQWTKVGGGSTKQDALPIAPGVGMVVVRNGATPVSLIWLGEVRLHAFAQPLVAGNNLVSQPFPLDQSPVDRLMTYANGFTGAIVLGNADQIMVYTGGAIQTYYLLRSSNGSINQWTRVGGGSTNYNAAKIIQGDGAVVVHKVLNDPDYSVPLSPLIQ